MGAKPKAAKSGTIRVIGSLKLAKGVLLVAFAVGAFSLLHKDVETVLTNLIMHLSIHPDSKYCKALITKAGHFQPKLPLLAIATFCYGALFCVEGIGLILLKRWAEYLTVIATGSFLPIELYEIIKHQTATRIVVLVVNVAIVIYLIVRLRKDRDSRSSSLHPSHAGA